MSKGITTEEFIKKATELHKGKYTYEKVDCGHKVNKKVCITCPKHGDFWMTVTDHLNGRGCRKCAIEKIKERGILTNEKFIEKAKKIHGNKYTYEKVDLEHPVDGKVCVTCPKHGDFWIKPKNHLSGSGCVECSYDRARERFSMGKEEFVRRAKEVHGDKYDYSKVEYINESTKVEIICPLHGPFWQTPGNHLLGKGCGRCAGKGCDTEEFIRKARKVHGDKYDYSKVKYTKNREKVTIICPIHGEFDQVANYHLNGRGCPKCAGNQQMTTEEFLEKVRNKFGERDDLSEVVYVNSQSIITPICPKHGKYEIKATNYLSGKRCRLCGIESASEKNKITMNQFLLKAREVHGYKDTFEKVDLKNRDEKGKVCITCKEHGDYWINPIAYVKGVRCPICGIKKRSDSNRKPFEVFKKEIEDKYGDKINVDNCNYTGYNSKITAVCKIHGAFETTPTLLLNTKYGCQKCAGVERLSFEDMVKRFREVHGDKYQYIEQPEGKCGVDHKMEIICPKHGKFLQTPYKHMSGCGCPRCSCNISTNEVKLIEYIASLIGKENIKTKEHKILERKEIDIFIPTHNLGFEFDGLYWHSEAKNKDKNYHLNKTNLAESKGIQLVHIFEDEWVKHETAVKNKVKELLHCNAQEVINIEDCNIKQIEKNEAKEFLEEYSVKGFVASSLFYGVFYKDKLVYVMSFLKQGKKWLINDFASNGKYCVDCIEKVMFNQFFSENNPQEVEMFLDRRWYTKKKNICNELGFSFVSEIKPSFTYKHNQIREAKTSYEKIFTKEKKETGMTDDEIKEALRKLRVWDCGKLKYVWYSSKE